jgi:hypothetical protein
MRSTSLKDSVCHRMECVFVIDSFGVVMSKEKLRKVLGLVESIVSVARCTFIPFHLGLAIELYHEYGSRTLIETLFSKSRWHFLQRGS